MKRGGAVCGAVSLTVIFCTLCMAVFAALTFVTANRERVFAELDAQRTAEFYRADCAATRIAAALRNGERTFAENLPEVVNIDGDALPEVVNVDGDALPEVVNVDADALPEAVNIDADAPEIRYTETDAGTLAEFSVPAGGQQRLDVRLLLRDGDAQILQWKKVYAGEWQNDDSITLADIDDVISLAEID